MNLGLGTLWDRKVALRAALIAGLALVVAWLVTASTDEGGIGWTVRAARVLPLAPACAALGTWLALVRARARGETLALESLGRTALGNAMGAVVGGAVVTTVAALAIAMSPRVDVSGFFPILPRAPEVVFAEDGFVEAARGVRIDASGALTASGAVPLRPRAAEPSPSGVPPHGRAAAALATALAGVALPLVIGRARRRTLGRVGLAVGTAVVMSIVLFHAAAARRAPVFAATLPPFVLLAFAAWRYRAGRWQTNRG